MSKKKSETKKPKIVATIKTKVTSKAESKRPTQEASSARPKVVAEAESPAAALPQSSLELVKPASNFTAPLPVWDATAMPALAPESEASVAKSDHGGDRKRGIPRTADPRLPQVPTTLVRHDRHGVVLCECSVGPDGIFYKGQQYGSLSGAASAASKDLGLNPVVNGYVFFGLEKPARERTSDVERLKRLGQRYEELFGAMLMARAPEAAGDSIKEEIKAHKERLQKILALAAA
ncbi:MAG: hypothetical protein SF187_23725 [Deltaproteobacteria bacterium]|nr:hypothetical protein [Deltaproteobacteria bacterium]